MSTTQEIVDAAKKLGAMIATHPAAHKFEASMKRIQGDVEAQRVLTDFNRLANKLGEKEAQGQPVEVQEKQQLEAAHNKVVRHPILQEFQMAQMDYLDLMRQVDDAISGESAAQAPAMPVSAGIR